MHKMSILLALSGSEQSYQAAELAWRLAKQADANLVAQHVVDTRTAWALLGNSRPGFIGSGLYVAAYESLCNSLRELAKKLADKYESMASAVKIKSDCLIDEGNPVHEICQRAKDHDLVITGHEPSETKAIDRERGQYVRLSIAEGLANHCPRPLLVVQGEWQPWKTLKILVSVDHLNIEYIRACMQTASLLGLQSELVCLATGVREESPENLIRDLREAHKELENMSIEVALFGDFEIEDGASLWSRKPVRVELDAYSDNLVVIPTREIGGKRITIFGSSPEMFIQHLTLPNILLFPEENIEHRSESSDQAKKLALCL